MVWLRPMPDGTTEKKKKEKDLPTPWETCMMQVSRTGGVEARDPAQGQFSACDD